MAHFLDRIIFTSLTVATAFLFTLNATNSLPAAVIAGMIAPHPLRFAAKWLSKRFSGSRFCLRRSRKRRAAETVRCWSVQRDASCREDILTLLKISFPATAEEMCLADDADETGIPVYPMMALRPVSEDTMADLLRRIREGRFRRAVIACTNQFAPEARALAQCESAAGIALIDGDMLTALLTKHPDAAAQRRMPDIKRPRPTLNRSHAAKLLPIALLMLGGYWIFDLNTYLIASMIMLWCCLMLLRKKPAPETLFR